MQFDVPGWLSSVMGWERDALIFESEREEDDYLIVTYSRGGNPAATVNLVALPLVGARGGTWQLSAQIGDRLEQVQVPAKTRFVWR